MKRKHKRIESSATEDQVSLREPPRQTTESSHSSNLKYHDKDHDVSQNNHASTSGQSKSDLAVSDLDQDVSNINASPLLLCGRYRYVKPLGQGMFSETHLYEDQERRSTYRTVAIKVMKAEHTDIGLNEIDILDRIHGSQASHHSDRHLVRKLAAFYTAPPNPILHIVLEALRPTPVSLLKCPHELANTPVLPHPCRERELALQKILLQVLLGLEFLHRNEIIHADLHPGNILWCEVSNRIKIIDFGNAIPKDMLHIYQGHFEICVEGYRAPELLFEKGPVTPALDIWSLGIIATEWVLTMKSPFMANGNLVPGGTEALSVLKELLGCGRSSGWDSYRGGRLWNSASEAIFVHGDQDDVGSLYPYLLAMTRSSGLVTFVMKMLKISPAERSSSKSLLKDQWLVDGLLGPWADILTAMGEPKLATEVEMKWGDDDTLLNIPTKDVQTPRKSFVQESFSSQGTITYSGSPGMTTMRQSKVPESPTKTLQSIEPTVSPSITLQTVMPGNISDSPKEEVSTSAEAAVGIDQTLTKTESTSSGVESVSTARKTSQKWHCNIAQYEDDDEEIEEVLLI